MNVPTCLQDLIGVCQGTGNAPSSGFYINDLEGINLEFAAAIADSNYKTGIALLENKIDFATLYTIQELKKDLLPFFRVGSTIDELRIGEFQTDYLSAQAAEKGVKLKIVESRMTKIRIDRILINIAETNFTHEVTISDGQNVIDFEFTTDSNGEAEIQADYLCETREVFVTMDNAGINPNNTLVKRNCNCYNKSSRFINGWGWSGSSNANTTFGLQVFSTAECDENELACVLSHRLALPVLYQTGVQIVKELVTTSRLNSFTMLDKEKGAFMLQEFEEEYKKQLNVLIATIPDLMNRLDDICVTCNGTRFQQSIP